MNVSWTFDQDLRREIVNHLNINFVVSFSGTNAAYLGDPN